MGTTQSNNLAQTPDNTPIADKDTGRVNFIWNQWFTNVQIKLNTITAAIIALSKNATAGFLSSDGTGGLFSRTLTAGTGITITNPTGAGGNPVISASGGAGGSPMHVTTSTSTSYTVQLTDAPASTANVGWIEQSNTSANFVSIDANSNVNFPVGTDLYISQAGAGTTTIKGLSGVFLTGGSITGGGQYAVGRAVQISTNNWRVFGNLAFSNYANYAATVIADGAHNYWKLNESSGTTAVDSVGTANGTFPATVLIGQTALYPPLLTCYSFPGTSTNYVSFTCPALSTNITVEAWIYVTATGYMNIINLNFNSGFRVQINGQVNVIFSVANILSTSAGTIALNTVYHIVAMSGTTGTFIYINGSLSASNATTWPGTPSAASQIGVDKSGGPELFSGKISNVAIYNSLLTPTQISNHYSVGV